MCLRSRTRITKKEAKRPGLGWGWVLGVGVGSPRDGTEAFLGSSRAKLPGRGCSMPRLPFTLLQSQ